MNDYSNELEPVPPDYNEQHAILHDTFCELYRKMKRNGLNEFAKDGKIFGYVGVLMIKELIEYFVSLEWYEECAVLRNLLLGSTEQKRIPQEPKEESVEFVSLFRRK